MSIFGFYAPWGAVLKNEDVATIIAYINRTLKQQLAPFYVHPTFSGVLRFISDNNSFEQKLIMTST